MFGVYMDVYLKVLMKYQILLTVILVSLFTNSVFAQTIEERALLGEEENKVAPSPDRTDVPLPVGVRPDDGDNIDAIGVRGNRRVEPDSIIARILSQVGKPLDLSTISEDIKRIYKLGFFEDIRVDATKTSAGKVIITFIVKEKPAIVKVSYVGNDEISEEDISDVVNLRVNQVLNVEDVKANAEKIRALYAEKGYFLAEVDHKVTRPKNAPFEAIVTFNINEFSKVEVKKISILGNEKVSDAELKNIMATREGDWGSFLTEFGSFKEEAFELDTRRITAFYYNEGYVDIKVKRPTVRLSRDKHYIYITIQVDEGPQYELRSVDIQGDLLTTKKASLALVKKSKVGTRFSYGKMREDAEAIRATYLDAGYAYANINPLIRKDNEGKLFIDVLMDVQKGNKVYFGRIDVVGNRATRDKVIRRELKIFEGELYSSKNLQRSIARVRRLGLFEKVDITTKRGKQDDLINARVEVTERPTGTLQFGFGLSSIENWIVNGSVSENNLLGRGQSLNLSAQISAIRTIFNLSFSEPWFLDSKWQMSASAYNFEVQETDFTRTSRGGSLTFGYPINDFLGISDDLVLALTYKLEDVTLRPGGRSGRTNSQVGNLFRDGLTSSLKLRTSYDTRDNRLFPNKGMYHSASVEVAEDNVTLSQNEFLKYDVESRVYFPLFWRFVLKLNAKLGYVQNVDANVPVPLFERYLVGGPNTVRGFERGSLGPQRAIASRRSDPSSTLTSFSVGGNKQLLLSAEIEFPILQSIGFKGVLFADAGNAFDNGENYSLKLDIFADDDLDYNDALRTSVGFGFRWLSPIGPLRFEWGVPLSRLRNERPIVFEFSIINSF